MKTFHLEVVTPSKSAYAGEVVSFFAPGTLGEFQVLLNHAPLMSSFEVGKIRIQLSDETEVIFATGGGVIEVKQNKVLVLADSLERAEEIDIQRAEASADRARQRLQNKSDSSIDSPRAEIALLRAINRLKIAGRR